jgi:hypothetical protein
MLNLRLGNISNSWFTEGVQKLLDIAWSTGIVSRLLLWAGRGLVYEINEQNIKETLLALVRDLFTFSSKVIKRFIIV